MDCLPYSGKFSYGALHHSKHLEELKISGNTILCWEMTVAFNIKFWYLHV